MNQGLWRHGISNSPESVSELCRRLHISLSDASSLALSEAGLNTVLDLLSLNGTGTLEWNELVLGDCTFLSPLRNTPLPPRLESVLLPGQCWSTENRLFPRSAGYVLEYLGCVGDEACVRIWMADTSISSASAHTFVTLPSHSFSRGGGTRHCYSYSDLWSDPTPFRVILGGDVQRQGAVCRQVISVHPFLPPSRSPTSSAAHPWLSSWVRENAQELRGCDIFTDGSCKTHSSYQAQLFNEPSHLTAGSVVMIEQNSGNNYGFMLHITDGEAAGLTSAAAMELFSATVACRIRKILYSTLPYGDSIHIFSDSQSTVNRVQASGSHALRHLIHKRQGALHYSLSRTAHRNLQTVHHISSHPERHKLRSTFTPREHGNALAHAAAALSSAEREFPGFVRFTIPATQLLKDLLCPGQWYIGDKDGTPLMQSTTELMSSRSRQEYLSQRDASRQSAEPPRPPFWVHSTIRLAARQFGSGRAKRTFAQQTRVTKIIYDKYYHGENRVKGCSDPALREELLACPLCGDYDSEEHGLCHCQGPRGDNILQPIRSSLFADITRIINTMPFGPIHAFLSRYRDYASDGPHAQRVWKGCLSVEQKTQLSTILEAPMTGKEQLTLLKAFRQTQFLLASAVLRIRTQLTSYAFPHMRGASLLIQPTAEQAKDMATLRNQPRITDAFGGPAAARNMADIASRNSIRKRRKQDTRPRVLLQSKLRMYPRDITTVTLDDPSTPRDPPAEAIHVVSSPTVRPTRTRLSSRIVTSMSPSPTPAPDASSDQLVSPTDLAVDCSSRAGDSVPVSLSALFLDIPSEAPDTRASTQCAGPSPFPSALPSTAEVVIPPLASILSALPLPPAAGMAAFAPSVAPSRRRPSLKTSAPVTTSPLSHAPSTRLAPTSASSRRRSIPLLTPTDLSSPPAPPEPALPALPSSAPLAPLATRRRSPTGPSSISGGPHASTRAALRSPLSLVRAIPPAVSTIYLPTPVHTSWWVSPFTPDPTRHATKVSYSTPQSSRSPGAQDGAAHTSDLSRSPDLGLPPGDPP